MTRESGRIFESALALALLAHRDQTDQGGLPYILHPLRVMQEVSAHGFVTMAVAVLHDAVEDNPKVCSLGTVHEAAGPVVAHAVDAITHRPHEPYDDYLGRVEQSAIATVVKVVDLIDNLEPQRLNQLPEADRVRLSAKYHRALRRLMGAPATPAWRPR